MDFTKLNDLDNTVPIERKEWATLLLASGMPPIQAMKLSSALKGMTKRQGFEVILSSAAKE